jgi:hypothetical protein
LGHLFQSIKIRIPINEKAIATINKINAKMLKTATLFPEILAKYHHKNKCYAPAFVFRYRFSVHSFIKEADCEDLLTLQGNFNICQTIKR